MSCFKYGGRYELISFKFTVSFQGSFEEGVVVFVFVV